MCYHTPIMKEIHRQFSVAPMMDYTDKHLRFLLRLLSKECLLYTEMITTPAILHGDKNNLLNFHPCEHPIAVQLGGSNQADLAECAKVCEDYGYDEIEIVNLYASNSNLQVREIAHRTGKSIGEIYRILQRHHVNPNRRKLNHHNVLALNDSGLPKPMIADMTGYTTRHVRNILNKRP